MRLTDFVGGALTLWRGNTGRTSGSCLVTTWCAECGAKHRILMSMERGGVRDIGTMTHQSWCSVDTRHIRRSIQSVRR
jgi:hypothetical protein